jgi:hypothetical protein
MSEWGKEFVYQTAIVVFGMKQTGAMAFVLFAR